MSLGLESGTVRVVPYNSEWPELFVSERERLQRHLSDAGLSVVIEHTGSTAVPGLAAKPILDILAGHPPHVDLPAYIDALTSAGYVHREERDMPEHEFFRRGNPRAYHIHLTPVGSYFWNDHLNFRNRLRADDELRDAYARLKNDLAARYPQDREAYIAGKESFVKDVLRLPPAP